MRTILSGDLVLRASDIKGELGLGAINFNTSVEYKFRSSSRSFQHGQRKMIQTQLEELSVWLEE